MRNFSSFIAFGNVGCLQMGTIETLGHGCVGQKVEQDVGCANKMASEIHFHALKYQRRIICSWGISSDMPIVEVTEKQLRLALARVVQLENAATLQQLTNS